MGCGGSTVAEHRIPASDYVCSGALRPIDPMPHYDLEELMYVDCPNAYENRDAIAAHYSSSHTVTYKVLLTGLENSGKSHLLYTLMQGPEMAVEPAETETVVEETLYITLGSKSMSRVSFHMYDLGGQKHVREKHIDECLRACFGIIFTVDVQSRQIDESREWLREVVTNEDSFVNGAPKALLVLGTKSDGEHTLTPKDIERLLVLPVLKETNQKRKYSIVFTTIASSGGHTRAAAGFSLLAQQMSQVHSVVCS